MITTGEMDNRNSLEYHVFVEFIYGKLLMARDMSARDSVRSCS